MARRGEPGAEEAGFAFGFLLSPGASRLISLSYFPDGARAASPLCLFHWVSRRRERPLRAPGKHHLRQPAAASPLLLFPTVCSKQVMQKRLEITTRGAQDAEGQFPRDRPNPAMKGFAPHRGLLQAGGFPALHCLTLCLLTAQPPLAMGPAELDPPAGLRPRAVPDAWGCPGVPPAAHGWGSGTGLAARPCPEGPPWGLPQPCREIQCSSH